MSRTWPAECDVVRYFLDGDLIRMTRRDGSTLRYLHSSRSIREHDEHGELRSSMDNVDADDWKRWCTGAIANRVDVDLSLEEHYKFIDYLPVFTETPDMCERYLYNDAAMIGIVITSRSKGTSRDLDADEMLDYMLTRLPQVQLPHMIDFYEHLIDQLRKKRAATERAEVERKVREDAADAMARLLIEEEETAKRKKKKKKKKASAVARTQDAITEDAPAKNVTAVHDDRNRTVGMPERQEDDAIEDDDASKQVATATNAEEVTEPQDGLCVICWEATKTHVVVPCGHLCLCENCTSAVTEECPMCRTSVLMTMKVY